MKSKTSPKTTPESDERLGEKKRKRKPQRQEFQRRNTTQQNDPIQTALQSYPANKWKKI